MKRILFLMSLLCISFLSFSQNEAKTCRLGFNYFISQDHYWGLGKPVVTTVYIDSPAEKAGLKINDIIERIDGVSAEGYSSDTIFAMLQEERYINLTVSNLGYRNKEITFSKDCDLMDAMNEKQLISAFAFYSLEDVQERAFGCPFKTTVNQDEKIDFLNYKTFCFKDDPLQGDSISYLNDQIKKSLEKRGLTYNPEKPDLYISTSYSFKKNNDYEPSENKDKLPQEQRYNVYTKTFEEVPIYYNPLIHERNVEQFLTLTINFIDPTYSTKEEPFVVWQCTANESLANSYSIKNYAYIHIPLILMQYPYPQTFERARFRYFKKKYNYTGINYDMDNFQKIAYVDPVSPAAQAGIETGDLIQKINDLKMVGNPKKLSFSYRLFIQDTKPLRNEKTKYADMNGYDKCMFWDVFSYPKIEDALKRPEYDAVFSYLFNFRPYVNMLSTNNVLFNLKRGKELLNIQVEPIITECELFENY